MRTEFPIVQARLRNGLRVVVSEDRVAPVVAVNVNYDVGSRHERQGRTGLAHLFEHLMFEGSRQVAPGEHFRLLSTIGGSLNATTSTERTNYFESVPAEHLDVALWLEADRMGGLLDALTQENLDNQRDVVRNERRERMDNVPYGTAWERVGRLLFPPGHPYHHQPIGWMDDLANATLEDCRQFFDTHYGPSNAVLTVVGDVDAEDALAAADRFFGGIPEGPGGDDHQEAAPPADPVAPGTREVVREDVPTEGVYLAYRLPPEGAPELDAIELGCAALGVGRASALHRRLVRAGSARAVLAFAQRRVGGASLGALVAHGRRGVEAAALEELLLGEVGRLAKEGLAEAELARAKAMVTRQWLQRVGEVEGRADELGYHTMRFGDPALVNDRLVHVLSLDAAAVAAAVGRWFHEAEPAVVEYRLEREAAAA